MTLAVRQEVGGAYVMALAFKKLARLSIPAVPRNFRSYGGSLLRPLLLVALYLCSKMPVSSSLDMWWWSGLARGVY
jgi:hypothetical protein